MKDIFIDNNIAKNFANPLDPEYKKLVTWLCEYNENILANNAVLTVSSKLIMEYGRTSSRSKSPTNIWAIIDKLTKEGRLNKITNLDIQEFKRSFFKKRILRRLTCNGDDREHIPVVMLSFRKYALVRDNAFRNDLINFPGFTVRAETKPENLPYTA